MIEVQGYVTAGRRTDLPVAEGELDADLKRTVRRASYMRQGFYVVVLLVALAGQVSGAVETLHIPLLWAVPAVGALELGGIVVMANADVRRRLGERALASRVLSAAIAGWAVTFNWLAHANHLMGGFFAGMSALGYLVWLMHTENQRRDRLRAKGDLPPTTPHYEVVGHWVRHPWLTQRAKTLAKSNGRLGLYESLAAARAEVRRERRESAISKVLHRKIRAAVDPTTADIAVAVYDLDEIAARLAAGADYDGLTALIAADLAPVRIAPDSVAAWSASRPALTAGGEEDDDDTVEVSGDSVGVLPPAVRRDIEDWLTRAHTANVAIANAEKAGVAKVGVAKVEVPKVEEPAPAEAAEPVEEPAEVVAVEEPVPSKALEGEITPRVGTKGVGRDGSLRSRVHATLDAQVPADDERDNTALIALVADELNLNEVERLTAATYVRTWKKDVESGRRNAPPGRQLQSVRPAEVQRHRHSRTSRKLAG
jgi:hypothetical protein